MPFPGRKKKFDCKKLKKTEINEDNLYVDKIWFQCENENCLKWRLLSSEDAAQVDRSEPWFCFMSTDPNHNTCSAAEECFPEESHVLKSGFKYVYSQLPIGSLVLVKLHNWPSWPGILCLDPLMGKYVTCDLDGNVEHYHVEFLGNPHSRKWIKANSVGHYSITLKAEKCKFNKRWYESALQEAYLLYAFSHEQRLEMCLLSKRGMPLVDKPEANIKAAIKAKKRLLLLMSPSVLLGEKELKKPLSSPMIASWWHLLFLLPLSYCAGDGGSQGGLGVQASLASAKDVSFFGLFSVMFSAMLSDAFNKDENVIEVSYCTDDDRALDAACQAEMKGFFKYSFEIACSDDALLKENTVVSETEDILKDLEQMLQEAGEPMKTSGESDAHGDEMHAEGKVSLCNTEISEEILCENQYEEDCLIIDGVPFRTGECIESITDKFKEIDALMSEF
ncbi:zinc finger CW-type PWWP domain protein 2 [Vombatus ursinus]|uniref:zinc finger CW-type PWWP domain protein 2 n=1 Tax=Vombatus ursinus TaxID=29139 RepID=UPI000FFCF61F|nr:zinc finger CW-type PWWP domain protein 2 [Vombatus ursinus]